MVAYDVRAKAQAGRQLATISNGGKGQAVTLTKSAPGSYNPATGATAAAAGSTQDGSGVEVTYSASQIDGSLIKLGDKGFHLSPLNVAGTAITAPIVDDTLTLADASVWTIKKVDPISPAGTPVMFILNLRGA